jgi:hypothetical protein
MLVYCTPEIMLDTVDPDEHLIQVPIRANLWPLFAQPGSTSLPQLLTALRLTMPVVVEAMFEVYIDLSAAKPQQLTPQLAQGGAMLITMGCGDACPYVPGLRREDWPLADPKAKSIDDVRTHPG